MAMTTRYDIRAQLGLRPVINVSGTMTHLGASIVVPEAIRAVRLADRPAEAPRPPNAVLSCRRLEETLGIRAPGWKRGVHETVRALVRGSG